MPSALADVEDLVEVVERLLRGLVQRRDGAAGELELAPGLQADGAGQLAVGALQAR